MPDNYKINWHGDKIMRQVERAALTRITAAGQELVEKTKENIGILSSAAGPSSPGEFPHKVTGELQAGISSHVLDSTTVIVQSTAPHAMVVEIGTHVSAGRPYLVRTLLEEAGRLGLTVVRGGKR